MYLRRKKKKKRVNFLKRNSIFPIFFNKFNFFFVTPKKKKLFYIKHFVWNDHRYYFFLTAKFYQKFKLNKCTLSSISKHKDKTITESQYYLLLKSKCLFMRILLFFFTHTHFSRIIYCKMSFYIHKSIL